MTLGFGWLVSAANKSGEYPAVTKQALTYLRALLVPDRG